MADDSSTVGEVNVDITGDFSPLADAIDQATDAASTGAEAIAGAFNVPDAGQPLADSLGGVGEAVEALVSSFSDLVTQDQEAQDAFQQAASVFNDVQSAFNEGEVSAGTLQRALEQLEGAAKEAGVELGEAGHEAEESESGFSELLETFGELTGIALTAEALKEFAEEAVSAYATVQSVTVGLTQLTGSAREADEIIEEIKNLAATEPFAFPEIAPTIQRMVALGVSAEQIPAVMQAVANASAATGQQFANVAQSFDRMALSGVANSRQLVTLGISTAALGKAMGVTADEVAAAFKALDQEDRITALNSALEKFSGAAVAQAQTIGGQWQILKNQFEEVMVGIGGTLAPALTLIMDFEQGNIKALGSIEGAVSSANNTLQRWVADLMTWTGVGPEVDTMNAAMAANLQKLSQGASAASTQMLNLGRSLTGYSAGLQALVNQQDAANKAIEDAKAVLGEANVQYAAGKISLGVLEAAMDAYEKAAGGAAEATQGFGVFAKELPKLGQEAATMITQAATAMKELGANANSVDVGPIILKMQLLLTTIQNIGQGGQFMASNLKAAMEPLLEFASNAQTTFITLPKELDDTVQEFGKIGQAVTQTGNDITAFAGPAKQGFADLGTAIKEVPTLAQNLAGAMTDAGLKSVESLTSQVAALQQVIGALERAKAASSDWTASEEQDLTALLKQLDSLNAQITTYGQTVDTVHAKTENWSKDFESEINSISNTFGKLIVEGGNFGTTMETIVEQLAEKIIGTLVQAAFGSLINAITGATTDLKNLGSLFNSIFGTGASAAGGAASAASGAGSAAGSAAGAAGGIASGISSGITGIVGAVAAVGTLITGVIGDIQGAHDEKVYGEIETNTRYASIVLQQLEPYFVDYLPYLAKIAGGSTSVGTAGTVGPDHSDLVNIADLLTEILGAMHVAAVAGGIAPGLYSESSINGSQQTGTINVTMNIQSNDPTQIARQLATMLRGRGVVFTPS